MPLLSLVRLLTTLASIAVLATAVYLAWRWYDGYLVRDADGDLARMRENWHLWGALALGVLSFFGKILVTPLLGRPDTGEPSLEDRGTGAIIPGANGSQIFVEVMGHGPTISSRMAGPWTAPSGTMRSAHWQEASELWSGICRD